MYYYEAKLESARLMADFVRAALTSPAAASVLKNLNGPVEKFRVTGAGLIGATLKTPSGTLTRGIGRVGKYKIAATTAPDSEPWGLALRLIGNAALGQAGEEYGVTGRIEFGQLDLGNGLATPELTHHIGPTPDRMELHTGGRVQRFSRQGQGWAAT